MSTKHAPERFPTELKLDTKVWRLLEVFRDIDQIGLHLIQKIEVNQDDHRVTYEKDLGPAMFFPHAFPLQFFAGNEYSVGEVMEIADRLREGRPERDPIQDQNERKPIGERFVEEREETRALRAHRTISGPHLTIQRG